MIFLLLEKLRPKFWKSKYFLEENIIFLSRFGPLIELIENFNMIGEVIQWFHLVININS
jgi:hypothetical protein